VLEELIKHAGNIQKDVALQQIRDRLATAFVEGELPRSLASVTEHVTYLEQINSPRQFMFALVDFVLWLNGERTKQEIPQARVLKDPFTLVRALPYDDYRLQIEGKHIRVFPSTIPIQGIAGKRIEVEAWLRRMLNDKFTVEVFICHEGNPCQLMWLNEEGMASVKVDVGYQVKPLKAFLEKP
jgi:hypothetical protein